MAMDGAIQPISYSTHRYEDGVEVTTSPLIGQEIHIIDDPQISVPLNLSDGHIILHDEIAAETVVTTTDIYSKPLLKDDSTDSGCSMEALEDTHQFTVNNSDTTLDGLDCDDPLSPPYGTSAWSNLEMSKFKSDISEEIEVGDSFVTLLPNETVNQQPISKEASIREITKREQDRLKKKLLREDPAYRHKEKEKARARMKLLRLDPAYRNNERQRDRQRRKAARQRDLSNRVKEKERDKEYKRQKRLEATSVLLALEDLDDSSYNTVVENVIGTHTAVENIIENHAVVENVIENHSVVESVLGNHSVVENTQIKHRVKKNVLIQHAPTFDGT